ncbi:MAG: Riboflavin transporter RfnT [Anaerolineales bacterium]|nr:Riboflavin transporter RfnT [Anaerolineales bacterium]
MTDFTRIARRTTFILFLAQSFASAGFIAAAAINPILGEKLAPDRALATVPVAVYQFSSALSASVWGRLMDRIGRRNGIALGLLMGMVGNALVILSTVTNSFVTMLFGVALMGTTNSATQLGRFAAAEVNLPEHRGRAISMVVFGGVIGTILSRLSAAPMGSFVVTLGMDELAGAYLTTLILFGLAAVVVFAALRPDPRDVGRQLAEAHPIEIPHGEARPVARIFRQPAAVTAVTAMVLGQVVMVAIMVITSLHMEDHHHARSAIYTVISAHTFGMYAPSLFSGWLLDKIGRGKMILVGSLTLLLSCVAAPLSPNVLPLGFALFLLGIGWNFCFVGGSTLLADQLSPLERSRTQGTNDFFMGLASSLISLSSGFIFNATGYAMMTVVAGALSLVPLGMVISWMRREGKHVHRYTNTQADADSVSK